ncbi:MAG: SPASM domain-containing protein [candidate division Zixibacteria bacterium]|nr:SPASM domain-containing protein [candidate division Zixibacteria bacterium]MDH3936232.1 SPASM domain-containing protein [candidate division Zixibacteria bacterium]MDH4035011.1 SPASM domain-containing protein [candidate division Zixibacteria bacterium]
MKPSKYAHLFAIEDGKALLFNGANGALAEIDCESYPQIKQYLSCDRPSQAAGDLKLWPALIENGFLVDDDTDELSAIESQSLSERLGGDCLSLTIAPTLACNFGCDYCFESQSALRMTGETEEALMDFAVRRLEKADSLMITWFGGEPTLCLPTIERLQAGFSALAARLGVTVEPSSIITNGYLLDRERAARLKAAGITTAQVTLDGPRRTHDQRRRLKNGRGTFDRIVDNIAQSCQTLDIVVRINIDRDNLDTAVEVLCELKDRSILDRLGVHFAQVTASGAACASVRDRCFTDREFSRYLVKLYQRLFAMGIPMVDYPEVFSGGHCGAVTENSFVVSPTGRLFRCWEELSTEATESTGNLFTEQIDSVQQANLEKYRAWDPFAMIECRKCDILPLCMGGCPLHGLKNNDADKGACSPFKHNLEDMLVLRYLYDARKEVIA